MKKVCSVALILLLAIAFVLTSCSSTPAESSSQVEESATSTEESVESSAEETQEDVTSADTSDETSEETSEVSDTETSEVSDTETSEVSDTETSDETSAESGEASDTETSDETSAEVSDDSSEETSEETSEEELVVPDYINQFVSFGTVSTIVNKNSLKAVKLTGYNVKPTYGSVVLYTKDYDGSLRKKDLTDFAVFVFEYNAEKFNYLKTESYNVGELTANVTIPDDGFVIVAHSYQQEIIARLVKLDGDTIVFPHGITPTPVTYTISKASSITIDGTISKGEWSKYKIETVDASNTNWSYEQFEKDNYYATANYYVAYDQDYLYLCVEVSSPYHYCPVTAADANTMWQYECIQVKVCSESPLSDYMTEHFDHASDQTANNEGIVRAYGFAVNNDGETCCYENSPKCMTFGGLVACTRDDANQTTVYEVAIPFAEFGITPEKGMDIGLTFSINSTNAEDVSNGVWKNITYRNGGGVIGRNDWSKIPVVTLG